MRTGLVFAVLFAVATGLHVVLTDRGTEEHYPRRFDRSGRLVLAEALLAGWAVGALAAPTSTQVVSLLVAFLGSGAPDRGRGGPAVRPGIELRLVPGRLVPYAGLLTAVTALSE